MTNNIVTAALTFELNEDGAWEYPTATITAAPAATPGVELGAIAVGKTEIIVTADAADIDCMLGRGAYRWDGWSDFGSSLDSWMHGGEAIAPNADALHLAIRQLMDEVPGDRAQADQQAAELAELADIDTPATISYDDALSAAHLACDTLNVDRHEDVCVDGCDFSQYEDLDWQPLDLDGSQPLAPQLAEAIVARPGHAGHRSWAAHVHNGQLGLEWNPPI